MLKMCFCFRLFFGLFGWTEAKRLLFSVQDADLVVSACKEKKQNYFGSSSTFILKENEEYPGRC